MEVLEIEPHWEILDSKRIELLRVIANRIMLPECYMGGGTALSLQMGLRKSVDFDFFTSNNNDLECGERFPIAVFCCFLGKKR